MSLLYNEQFSKPLRTALLIESYLKNKVNAGDIEIDNPLGAGLSKEETKFLEEDRKLLESLHTFIDSQIDGLEI